MFVLQITILSALLVENYFTDETKAMSVCLFRTKEEYCKNLAQWLEVSQLGLASYEPHVRETERKETNISKYILEKRDKSRLHKTSRPFNMETLPECVTAGGCASLFTSSYKRGIITYTQ
jgi:hypothetical protein